MKYDFVAIGDRIRKERKQHGLTQAQLLEELENRNCSIGGNTLSALENGKLSQEKISMLVFLNLAEILGTNIYYLLGESNHKTKIKETIWKKLRLRGNVVDRISDYDSKQIAMLNSLVCYKDKEDSKDNLKQLLDAIYEYKLISTSDMSSVKVFNPMYRDISREYTQREDIEKYLKYRVISCLEDCLQSDYWITDDISKSAKLFYDYRFDPENSELKKSLNKATSELWKDLQDT